MWWVPSLLPHSFAPADILGPEGAGQSGWPWGDGDCPPTGWPDQGWPSCTHPGCNFWPHCHTRREIGGPSASSNVTLVTGYLWAEPPSPDGSLCPTATPVPPFLAEISGFPEKALPAAGTGCRGDQGTLLLSLDSSDIECTGAFPGAPEGDNDITGEVPGGNSPGSSRVLLRGGFTGDPAALVTPEVPGNPNSPAPWGSRPGRALSAALPAPANPGISSQMPGTGLLQVTSIPRGGGYGHQSAGN